MFRYVYTVVILYNIISTKLLVNTASITSELCDYYELAGSSKFEINCYNYKNLLRFNISLSEYITTINLINNYVNALDSSSFPYRSEKLEKLDLSTNIINELPPGVLKNFPNLQILDLTKNNISEFHADVFLDNKQLREIYLDGNNFEILKLQPFRNLVHLKKVTLENNHLEGCNKETLETLDYFRKKGIDTDVPNLCIQINVSQVDLVNVESTTRLNIGAASTEKTGLNLNKISDSVKNLIFGNFNFDKKLFYFCEAFVITSLSALGLLSFICIIRRHKRKNNRRTKTYSGNFLIVEEESGYLTPKKSNACPIYLEILAEIDRASIKSERLENYVARSPKSNCRLQPKIHKKNHVYEEIKLPHEIT